MNPIGEFMQRLRQAAILAVSEDDIREIFRELAKKAKRGDIQAARLLFAHILPPQPTAVRLSYQEQGGKKAPKGPTIEHRPNGLLTHTQDEEEDAD